MPDLLVNLCELPPSEPVLARLRSRAIEVRRGLAAEKSTVATWVANEFSVGWSCECEIAFTRQPVACIIAVHGEIICGFSCYGITCPDFFGPLGVAAEWREHDIGTALLFAGLEALRTQGYAYAIIGWAGPVAFFEKAVGAKVIENSEPGIYRGMLKKRPGR